MRPKYVPEVQNTLNPKVITQITSLSPEMLPSELWFEVSKIIIQSKEHERIAQAAKEWDEIAQYITFAEFYTHDPEYSFWYNDKDFMDENFINFKQNSIKPYMNHIFSDLVARRRSPENSVPQDPAL